MTAFAINVPARTVRAFPTAAEAMNAANVGEQVFASAVAIERQRSYSHDDLLCFYQNLSGRYINQTEHKDKISVARAIWAFCDGLATDGVRLIRTNSGEGATAEPNDLPESEVETVDPEDDGSGWLDPETASPDAVPLLVEGAESGVVKVHGESDLPSILAQAQSRILVLVSAAEAKIARYRELAATPGADEHENLRVEAAQRELSNLVRRLTENSAADVERARFAAEGIAYLETVAPSVLAVHAATRPKPEPKPFKGRGDGETRGRRSDKEGKRFTALRKMNLFGSGTRRRASFQLVLDHPGIGYEEFIDRGGHPADLGIFVHEGAVRMDA